MSSEHLFNLALALSENSPSVKVIHSKAKEVFARVDAKHPAVEFGTRAGGSAYAVLSAIFEQDSRRPLISVDPYGGLPQQADVKGSQEKVYTNDLYRNTMEGIAAEVRKCKLNWTHYMMRDADYLDHVWPHVPLYVGSADTIRPLFSFAYLDAEHTEASVRRQLARLKTKMAEGGVIAVANAEMLASQGQTLLDEYDGVFPGTVLTSDSKKWLFFNNALKGDRPVSFKQILEDAYKGASPDWINSRWTQSGPKFGGGMAIEVEVAGLLYGIIRSLKPERMIETGTHKGLSTAFIAQALKENGFGHLHTIDVADHGVPSMLAEYGLEKHVTYIRGDSRLVLKGLAQEKVVNFLWLDALHDTDFVLAELESALPGLRAGSYVAFHDTTSDPGEGEAVKRIRSTYPSWEYLHFRTARGFDLMRIQ